MFGEGDAASFPLFAGVRRFGVHLSPGWRRRWFSFIHAADLAAALIAAAQRGARLPPAAPDHPPSGEGVYFAATVGSETTAAATGAVGVVRRDPMAMLPFCGYHIGNYFSHWLKMAERATKLPAVFVVNWFRKDEAGKFAWPGYGQNMRVLKWIIDRSAGRASAMETPIGFVPRLGDLDLRGIDASNEAIEGALRVDRAEWEKELEQHGDWFEKLGGSVPDALRLQRRLLLSSIRALS